MSQALANALFGWEITISEDPDPDRRSLPLSGSVHQSTQPQPSRCEQSAELRHDMANILSLLQLRVAIIKRNRALSDDELVVFAECLTRLRDVLDCWRCLEAKSANSGDEQADLH